jgi:hypothetical protein
LTDRRPLPLCLHVLTSRERRREGSRRRGEARNRERGNRRRKWSALRPTYLAYAPACAGNISERTDSSAEAIEGTADGRCVTLRRNPGGAPEVSAKIRDRCGCVRTNRGSRPGPGFRSFASIRLQRAKAESEQLQMKGLEGQRGLQRMTKAGTTWMTARLFGSGVESVRKMQRVRETEEKRRGGRRSA